MSRKIRRLKPKKIKGRITVLKAMPYKGNMVYIRMIDGAIFEWMLVFKNQIYSSYMVITPRKGETKLSKDEITQSAALLWAGAETTIDTLSGEKIDKKQEAIVNTFEGARKGAEKMIKKQKKEVLVN